MSTHRAINFSAGPSKVPEEVLREAQAELLNYDGTGISVMELSHRSSTFGKIITDTEKDLRDVLSIPDSYSVLFMHGGGTGQFASIPLNLLQNKSDVADYLVTGSWSDKAKKEADKYVTAKEVVPKRKNYQNVPDPSEWSLSPNAKYFYYCDNETIYGVEFPNIPSLNNGAYLVADMSSNFLTRQFDVTKYGLIYAAVQKNVGIAGLAIVIIRNDLIGDPMAITPSVLNFKLMKENKSLYNTPPCFQIYITGLFLKWIKKNGGLKAMEELSQKKSSLIYDVIDNSSGFYSSPVERSCRSRVTIPFRVGGSEGNPELEAKFLKEAEALHMVQLKGHRSVGGIRASLYNAMTLEETKVLEKFMRDFALRNA